MAFPTPDESFTVVPTPDDGVRRSASLPWDETARPSGPDHGRLREAVDLLSDVLLSHLSYEERELVEPRSRLGIS
jgi:hypothetical protein